MERPPVNKVLQYLFLFENSDSLSSSLGNHATAGILKGFSDARQALLYALQFLQDESFLYEMKRITNMDPHGLIASEGEATGIPRYTERLRSSLITSYGRGACNAALALLNLELPRSHTMLRRWIPVGISGEGLKLLGIVHDQKDDSYADCSARILERTLRIFLRKQVGFSLNGQEARLVPYGVNKGEGLGVAYAPWLSMYTLGAGEVMIRASQGDYSKIMKPMSCGGATLDRYSARFLVLSGLSDATYVSNLLKGNLE